MALAGMLNAGHAQSALGAESANPMLPKPAQFPSKVKHVIHLFMNGGPSQVDTFDPKPELQRRGGQTISDGNLKTERPTGALFPSPYRFHRYGQSGIEVSELFPHVAQHVDDMAIIRSMHADVPNHEPSLLLMNCGEARLVRPSMGSWLTYGLGTENQNLPAFVAMCPGGYPIQESQNWQSGFLPGVYQGTYVDTKHTDIEKLIENIATIASLRKISLDNWVCCSRSTNSIWPNGPVTLNWNHGFSRLNWHFECRRRRRMHSMSLANQSIFETCTVTACRHGRF